MPETTPEPSTDPHGLLSSGQEVGSVMELSRLLGLPLKYLRALIVVEFSKIRYCRYDGKSRYSVDDVKRAIGGHEHLLEVQASVLERRRRHEEMTRAEHAAGLARREAKKRAADAERKAKREAENKAKAEAAAAANRRGKPNPRR